MPSAPPRVGFVVSKAVGNAVVRNRVKRRLRHLLRERVAALPDGCLVVVRANPGAADSDDLARDLDRALAAVLQPNRSGSGGSRRDLP
jgi:ribonuclease P protein component